MDIETLPIVLGVVGFVMLYGAVKNKNPLDLVKRALTGEDLDGAAPLDPGAGNFDAGPGAIPGQQIPGTPGDDGDARTDPPSFDPRRDDVIPRLPGEGIPNGGGVVSYPTRTPFARGDYWV